MDVAIAYPNLLGKKGYVVVVVMDVAIVCILYMQRDDPTCLIVFGYY